MVYLFIFCTTFFGIIYSFVFLNRRCIRVGLTHVPLYHSACDAFLRDCYSCGCLLHTSSFFQPRSQRKIKNKCDYINCDNWSVAHRHTTVFFNHFLTQILYEKKKNFRMLQHTITSFITKPSAFKKIVIKFKKKKYLQAVCIPRWTLNLFRPISSHNAVFKRGKKWGKKFFFLHPPPYADHKRQSFVMIYHRYTFAVTRTSPTIKIYAFWNCNRNENRKVTKHQPN